MGFMFIEVVLIQHYAALIGPSLYSIATVLLSILVFSGLGSRVSPRVPERLVFGAIVGWLCLDILLFPSVVAIAGRWEIAARVAVAAILIAPLGFFLGMPFPKGGLRVGPSIDWGFAVNGSASVLGATLVLLIAFVYGFRVALALAACLYAFAYGLLGLRERWERQRLPLPEATPQPVATEPPPLVPS
jgi:hypothetical protein